MIITYDEIEYNVQTISGWQHQLYDSLTIDVLRVLATSVGVRNADLETMANEMPNIFIVTYKPFVDFCLSTKASDGPFQNYNIAQLVHIVNKYEIWLDLFNQPGFYDIWIKAYQHENKEEISDDSQKKEANTD